MQPSFLSYVQDPVKAASFYEKLLGAGPVEASPGFAMFALAGGAMLGLWKRDHVEPKVTAAAGSNELGFGVETNAAVDRVFSEWKGHGVTVLQAPTQMDFGYTFTVADPDGNRLRVFAAS